MDKAAYDIALIIVAYVSGNTEIINVQESMFGPSSMSTKQLRVTGK